MGKWKLNVDAAFFQETQQTGVGMVLRNEQGDFIVERSVVIMGCVDVDVGENLGFYEALLWLIGTEIESIIVEGDA
ncbi:hypothetical protein ACS0TY_002621 [Phlomoides rotata]